jgi:diguanylate cyclase (GGDEF)-like protein/PAS domain S-box-containing protein
MAGNPARNKSKKTARTDLEQQDEQPGQARGIAEHERAEQALRDSEASFRAIFEQAAVGITRVDFNGVLVDVNQKFCDMLGYRKDELLGKHVKDITHTDDYGQGLNYRVQLAHREMKSAAGEKRFLRKDGSILWARRTMSTACDAAGEPLYVISIVEDITEHKQAEERYRATFDNAPVGIMHTAVDGDRILHANAKLSEMLGYTYDELVCMATDQFIHPDYVGADQPKYREQMLKGELNTFASERLYRRKDGSDLWVNRTVSLAKDSAGNPLYFIRIIEDITERKLAARQQAMEHAVTQALAESAKVEEAMPVILRTICQALGWTCGAHWKWHEAEELLRCTEAWHDAAEGVAEFVAASRERPNEAPAWRGGPPGTSTGGVVRRVWFSGDPAWFADVMEHPDFRRGPAAARAGLHSAFGFPILAGTQPLGVMEFYNRDIQQPDEALLRMVRAIGSQIGLFIQRKEAERALRKSEERYRDVFEASPLPMWVWDDETLDFVDVNQATVDHYGYSRDEFNRMNVRDIWAFGEEARYEANIRNRAQQPDLHLQRRHRTKDGRVIDVEVTVRGFMLGGRPVWLTLINDITDRKRAEAALHESEEQFKQLAGNIPQVFWITDVGHKKTLYISPAASSLTGRLLPELYGGPRALVRALHPEDRRRVYDARRAATGGGYDQTYRVVRSDGAIRWVNDRAFPVRDESGTVYRIAGIAEDVTEKKLAEEQLMQLAHYDVLTRLPNRALFYDRMKQTLALAKRNEWTVGVMFIDLDRFKNVNDTLGHAVGDQLLQQVSERLAGSVRAGDTVGRLGGDEFAIVLSNLSNAQDASLVAQKIMAAFVEPFQLEGSEIYVTASIGITLYPDDSADQDTLIRNADAAMYRAKEAGRNSYQFYTSEMNARALENLSLESNLRRALERKEFLLHYQPKARLDTGAITGFEALLRWKHGDQTVAPEGIIPILEETGLIVPVGEWVIRSVCEQLRQWKEKSVNVRPIAVNLSARQFQQKNLAAMVEQILRETGIAPYLLELELTETMLMSDPEDAAQTLRQLKALGARLSIDDFGTGYSSLAYLKRFPLDALKIDRGFIRDAVSDPDDAAIVCTIISLAHSLKLKVVAEGVETEGQLCFLKANGCDEMQGFYFARPLPVEECGRALAEDRRLLIPQTVATPDGPVLLIVDDDENELLLLKRALAAGGFHILTASTALAGFELLARHRAEIVISDQHMPEMTGVEFLSNVRKLYPNALRIVVSNGDDAPTLTRATNRAGIHKFLSKNWDPERLCSEVREAMRARLEATAPVAALRPPA